MENIYSTVNQGYAPKRYLRIADIVRLYPIGRSAILNYGKQGLITPIRVTKGVIVYDANEIEAFFSGKKAEAQNAKA